MYYDTGWNDYIANKAFAPQQTIDWKDGYKDAEEYHENYGALPEPI